MSSRVTLRRSPRTRLSAPGEDFAVEERRRGVLRPTLAGLAVGALALATGIGVLATSASHGTEQNQNSLVVDERLPDQSKAEPTDTQLSAEQVAALESQESSRSTTAGGLQAFGQRGTTVNRSSVRTSLDSTIIAGSSTERSSQLKTDSSQIALTAAQAEQQQREQQMEADLVKVRAEAKRIAEEKRKAAELLKAMQAKAKADAAAKAAAARTQGSSSSGSGSGSNTPGSGVNLGDLSALVSNGGALPVPLGRATIGAHWGAVGSWARYHTGQDFPAPTGTPIFAAASGVVGSSTGASGWAGNYVVIHHSNGGSTLYAHMSRSAVSPGQVVKAGQVIGFVGNTGRSFGSHLHFEYYPPGTTPGDVYAASDPMAFVRSLGVKI